MLFKNITALCADIIISFVKPPIKEDLRVENITLEKDGKLFLFDWDEHSCVYRNDVLLIQEKSLSTMVVHQNTTLKDLEKAVVKELSLLGSNTAVTEKQFISNIKLCLYDEYDENSRIVLTKNAFQNADLGQFYEIAWED